MKAWKWTIYGAVLLVGAGIVAADQFSRPGAGGPAPQALAEPAVAAGSVLPAKVAAPAAGLSLTERLAQMEQGGGVAPGVRDPFSLAGDWAAAKARPVPQTSHQRPPQTIPHTLSGTMVSASGSYAIVDGRAVRLGEVVGGMKLLAVQRDSARFQTREGPVVLRTSSKTAPAALANGGD